MRTRRSIPIAGALGFCLLAAGFPRLPGPQLSRPARATLRASFPPAPRTPSAVARRLARRHYLRAEQAVIQERYDLEAWDPDAVPSSESEAWRLQLMARDRSGELRRALDAVRQAAALARTPPEAYEATLLRVRLEEEAGHLDIALGEAERLMAARPHDLAPVMLMRRAVREVRREASMQRPAAGRNGRPRSGEGR